MTVVVSDSVVAPKDEELETMGDVCEVLVASSEVLVILSEELIEID